MGGELLSGSYNPVLVVLSFVVAVFSCYSTLSLVSHMRHAREEKNSSAFYWWAGASVTLGGGIFAMHFVAMLAFSIPVTIRYDFGVTVASLLAAILSSALPLRLIQRQKMDGYHILLGGILMGMGVALMHYLGMAGLLAPALLRFVPQLWMASLLVAIIVSVVALLLMNLYSRKSSQFSVTQQLAVAIVLALAVSAMHYTGMAAAEFYSGGSCGVSTGLLDLQLNPIQLGINVALVILLISGIALIASVANERFHNLLVAKNIELEQQVVERTERIQKQNVALQGLELALNQHAIVSIANRQGTIIEVNDKFCEISGYRREELIGQNHRMLKSGKHPDHFYRTLWQTIASGKVWQGEVINLKKGGQSCYTVQATILPFVNPDGEIEKYISVRTDITAIRQVEQQLLESKRRFQQLVDDIGEGHVLYSEDPHTLELTYVSREFEAVTGLDPQKVVNKPWMEEIEWLPESIELGTRKHHELMETGRSDPYEISFYHGRTGELHILLLSEHLTYDDKGEVYSIDGLATDITEAKRTEKLLREQKEELFMAMQAKDDFLATMSHELRTPLASIIGNSQLLGKHQLEEEAQELLHTIEVAGRDQLALVNDILDMSKIESGKFTVEDSDYDLVSLVQDLQRTFSARAREHGLVLQVEQQVTPNHLLTGDLQRIRQILMNLLGNALKFTEQGTITLGVGKVEGRLQFVVEDSGIGMSQETVSRLFQRFEQADGSISRRFGGSGLGLYISQNLARLMGGTIEVESEVDKGSRFRLSLPWRESDKALKREQPSRRDTGASQSQLRGSVLIAEDTPMLQILERRILEANGLTVTIAGNGEEAVELARSEPFDLILMDMQMPIMDGIEATRRLREEGNQIPVVALTANVMQKHREAFEAAGCNDFLGKPIDQKLLLETLSPYLGE